MTSKFISSFLSFLRLSLSSTMSKSISNFIYHKLTSQLDLFLLMYSKSLPTTSLSQQTKKPGRHSELTLFPQSSSILKYTSLKMYHHPT